MKILHVHSLHLHRPWLDAVSRAATQVDAVTIAGDSLPIASSKRRDDDELEFKRFIAQLAPTTVYYSRGLHDPDDMDDWQFKHLRLSGTHEQLGWAIHVMDTYSVELRMPRATTLPEIVVTHFPPVGCECAVDMPSETNHGRGDVRAILQGLGDIRLVLCGRVWRPRDRIDWAEGTVSVCPGMSCAPGTTSQEPAYVRVDCEERALTLFDGLRVRGSSFAR